jgi:hypothetical protein
MQHNKYLRSVYMVLDVLSNIANDLKVYERMRVSYK